MKCFIGYVLISFCVLGAWAEDIRFPAGSGVIDLSLSPYSADKTGVADATSAIQQAIDDYPNGNRILYLPNGTYKVSDTLRWSGTGGNAMKRTILQGQSRDGTIIQLVDNASGFQDPNNAKGVIWTGQRPAQRFRNAIRNLTVNTGSGNPGASGLQFYTSNQGGIFDVKVISGDGQGVSGLDMSYPDVNENGPMLVRNLEVVGFDFGVNTTDFINSMTFENLVLRDQNIYGLRVWGHVLSVRGMTFEGDVPAVYIWGAGAVSILDAVFTGTGAAFSKPAIEHERAGLYLRNVTSTGYDRLAAVEAGSESDILDDVTGEWAHGGGFRLFGEATPISLQLTVKESPNPPAALDDPAGWVSPMAFGAAGNGVTDDSAAVQAAIDSGAKVVYLDGGKTFNLTDTIYLRGNLERLIGLEGNVAGDVVFELGSAGTAPVVWIERMRNFVGNGASIRHNSSRTLVVRNLCDFAITGDGSGDFFLDDFVGGPIVFNHPDQHIWARQFNAEQKTVTKVQNHGATLWVLGMKTENRTMAIRTDSGGVTEVIGTLVYANDSTAPTDPIFEIDEAEGSFVGIGEYGGWTNDFPIFVREIRSGETRELLDDDLPGRVNAANMMMLFAGHERTGGGTTGYNAWSAGFEWPGAGSDAPGEDADEDGVKNLIEYAFGSDPTNGQETEIPGLQVAGPAGLTLRYRARKNAMDLTYTVYYSQDLSEWFPFEGQVQIVDPDVDGDGSYELSDVEIPLPLGWRTLFGTVDVQFQP